MLLTVFLAVILAAFLHATWNEMVKNEKDKYLGVAAIVFGRVPASIVIIFYKSEVSVNLNQITLFHELIFNFN